MEAQYCSSWNPLELTYVAPEILPVTIIVRVLSVRCTFRLQLIVSYVFEVVTGNNLSDIGEETL